MIFALGFVAASLIALLIIPAINARAERLARRRAEALFPMSISELTAEKDHLRAEFAVLQRRIERKAEEALAVKRQSMEELGRRAIRIEALESTLAERDQTGRRSSKATWPTPRRGSRADEEDLAQTRTCPREQPGNPGGPRERPPGDPGRTVQHPHGARAAPRASAPGSRTELLQAEEKLARLEAESGRCGTAG